MAGPLEGLRVVEVGWGSPGSITGMLFADYGARVIKVERPGGGSDQRSITRRAWDRGKWSVELDLDADRQLFLGLLAGTDVLIDSLGRAYAIEHGLTYEVLHEQFPGLV